MGFYRNTYRGRLIGSALSYFFCSRLYAEGLSIDLLLSGDIVWTNRDKKGHCPQWNSNTGEGLRSLIFQKEIVCELLQPVIPMGHLWWTEGTGSTAIHKDWWHWFTRGRGPMQGWLFNRLHQQNKAGTRYLPTLNAWPGGRYPFQPIAYENSTQLEDLHVRNNKRRTIKRVYVMELLERQSWKCFCGRDVHFQDVKPEVSGFQVDHIIARTRSENFRLLDELDNYCILCTECNLNKGTKTLQTFLASISGVNRNDKAPNSHLGRKSFCDYSN